MHHTLCSLFSNLFEHGVRLFSRSFQYSTNWGATYFTWPGKIWSFRQKDYHTSLTWNLGVSLTKKVLEDCWTSSIMSHEWGQRAFMEHFTWYRVEKSIKCKCSTVLDTWKSSSLVRQISDIEFVCILCKLGFWKLAANLKGQMKRLDGYKDVVQAHSSTTAQQTCFSCCLS